MYYYIIEFASVTQDMIDVTITDSIDTLRHSINPPDRVVIKTAKEYDAFTGYSTIDESTLLTILAGTDWSTPTPITSMSW